MREHHEKVHREISFNVIKQTHGASALSENDINQIAERVVPSVGVLTNYQAHLDFYKHSLKQKITAIVTDEMQAFFAHRWGDGTQSPRIPVISNLSVKDDLIEERGDQSFLEPYCGVISDLTRQEERLHFQPHTRLDKLADFLQDEIHTLRTSVERKLEVETVVNYRKRVIEMLAREPTLTKSILKNMWQKLRVDKISLFEEGWRRIEPKAPLFAADAEYQEWASINIRYKGMRHRQFRRKHGIVRSESSLLISESSYRHEKLHGLQIKINSDTVQISLYRMGEPMANFVFDENLNEMRREDPMALLRNWNAELFRA